jgi:nucleoside-diphosphate-sugar epimerase
MDTFLYGQTPFLDRCGDGRLEIRRDDVRVGTAVSQALRGQDAIVALAAIVGAPACQRDITAARTINLEAIRLLLSQRSPDQPLIFPMSNSGYGICPPGQMCGEDSPLKPVSLYGRLKVAAEEAVLNAPNTVSLRFATLFGASPRMRRDLLVNDFTWRAATDGWLVLYEGHFRRNFLHVWDAAGAILWALAGLTGGMLGHRVYNAGLPDANLTKRELCEAIRRHLPRFHWVESRAEQDPDRRDYVVDHSRILAEGWKPERTLEEGIQELLKCYQILAGRPAHANA